MFIFAQRSTPVNVIDAEGVHAKRKWVEHVRPLNILRLSDFIDKSDSLPNEYALRPHIRVIQEALLQQYGALMQSREVPCGMRSSYIMQERLSLPQFDVDHVRMHRRMRTPLGVCTVASCFSHALSF